MKLTQKLLGFLNRVFDKDPGRFLALRMRYAGTSMTWTIADKILTTQVVGGVGANLTIDLSAYTVSALATYVAAQPGYSVPYVDASTNALLSALVLIDGTGNQDASNGDHIDGYTSLLWAYLDSVASDLKVAGDQVVQMLRQMVVGTAEGEWLDELGGYYATPRQAGEADAIYAARIIASVGRPRGNNVALEMAINTITGGLAAKVTDYPTLTAFTAPYSGNSYGLFDVVYSVALDGPENLGVYTSRVSAIVEAFRDAGTHIRTILISGALADTYATASIVESQSAMNIAMATVTESLTLGFKRHDGTYRRDGSLVSGGTPGPLIQFNQGGEMLTITRTVSGVVQPPESL